MSKITNICIEDDVYFCEEFQELVRTRKLSRLINTLLRNTFNIKKNAEQQSKEKLIFELNKVNSEKALLTEQLKALQEREEKEKTKWTTIIQ